MFKGHQGGAMLETHLTSPGLNVRDIVSKPDFICSTRETVSHATASATLSADGTALTLTMTNADLEKTLSYSGEICGAAAASLLSARVLRDDPRAQNTYDEPDKVRPEKLDLKVRNNKFNIELPPCSVVAAEFALSL
jgi:alpha-L-arabinofuranosidase